MPDLVIVVDHIGKPAIREGRFDDWVRAMRTIAEYPQVRVKLSGMVTEADWHRWQPWDLRRYVLEAIALFGVDRVMYGSDWPVCLLAGSYAEVLCALLECLDELDEDEKAQVLGGTASRVYGLV